MIYIKESQVYYLTAQPVGELYYDLYNLTSMRRTDNAYKDLMNFSFTSLGLEKSQPLGNQKYLLILDFLSTQKTEYLEKIIEYVLVYLSENNFDVKVNDNPLRVIIDNLKIEDVVNFIQDGKFQTINNMVETASSSVWRLYKK
jgi:hypothetical protein